MKIQRRKSKSVAAFFAVILAASVFLAHAVRLFAEETEEAVAMLTEMSGSVLVKDAQEDSFKKAVKDQPLYEGDEIQTKKGASCEIEFKTESIVRLDENSYFKLNEAKETSKGNKTSLKLFYGKTLNVVNKTSGNSFKVETPTSVAGVRGTEFAVEAADDATDVGVFDGTVSVQGVTESGSLTAAVDITQDTETSIQKFKKPGAPQKLKEKMQRWKQFLMKHRPRLYEKLKQSPELRKKLKKFVRRKMAMKKLKDKWQGMPGTPEEKKGMLKKKFQQMPEEKKEMFKKFMQKRKQP